MEPLKRRHAGAVKRAKNLLENPPASYKVFLIRDSIFDMIAIKPNEILALKIVLDEISSDDVQLVRKQRLPEGVTKKILKKEFRMGGFEEKILK